MWWLHALAIFILAQKFQFIVPLVSSQLSRILIIAGGLSRHKYVQYTCMYMWRHLITKNDAYQIAPFIYAVGLVKCQFACISKEKSLHCAYIKIIEKLLKYKDFEAIDKI